jgi:hypothetical protein
VTAFWNADQLAKDVARVNDAARGKWLSIIGMALAAARNYDPFKSPTHFKLSDLLKKLDKTFGATGKNYGKVGKTAPWRHREAPRDRWNFLFIAGMWFQDLFNYDFRRTEQCIIPYATQEGEISFCAYNTGVGWRNIIEKMHMTATLTKWYEEHGRTRSSPAARGAAEERGHSLVLREDIITNEIQHDLDRLGIAKNRRRREDPRPRRQAQAAAGKRPHGQAVSRARAERQTATAAAAKPDAAPIPSDQRGPKWLATQPTMGAPIAAPPSPTPTRVAITLPRMAGLVESCIMLFVDIVKVRAATPITGRAAANHQYPGENAASVQPIPKTPVPRSSVPNFGLPRPAARSAALVVPIAMIDDSKPNPRASAWKTFTAMAEMNTGKLKPNVPIKKSMIKMDRRSGLCHT